MKTAAAQVASTPESTRAITWELVKKEALVDNICIELVHLTEEGFHTTRSELPDYLRPFWQMRHELHRIDGVPFLDH